MRRGRDLASQTGYATSVRLRRIVGLAGLVAVLLAAPAQATDDPLQRYAEGTWASFVGMTFEESGGP